MKAFDTFKNRNAKSRLIFNRFFLVTLLVAVLIVVMVLSKIFDIDYFIGQEYKSIQFNLLTVNSILIGFLFTFLGIFITASETDSLKENRAYSKFGVMVWSIVVGLISVAISLVINIVVIILKYDFFIKVSNILIVIEVSLMLVGVGLFLSTTFDSIFLMRMIRRRHLNYKASQVKGFRDSIKKKQ